MYSRSFYPDTPDRPTLPENYDGTFLVDRNEPEIKPEEQKAETVQTSVTTPTGSSPKGFGIPFLSDLFGEGGFLGKLGLGSFKIGTEEILILATAAFLFFSKNGDKECALILLLLLFIN